MLGPMAAGRAQAPWHGEGSGVPHVGAEERARADRAADAADRKETVFDASMIRTHGQSQGALRTAMWSAVWRGKCGNGGP